MVQPDSPADRAGLKDGDVIVALDGKAVTDRAALRNRTAALPVGQARRGPLLRDGEEGTAEVTIAELPALLALGVRLRELTAEQAANLPGAPKSALIVEGILPGTPAHRAGLWQGVRLLGVGPKAVSTIADCNEAVAALDPTEGVPLHVQAADGREAIVTLGGPLACPHPLPDADGPPLHARDHPPAA